VTNTATVAAPVGMTDPDMSDNTATDTDTVLVIDTPPTEIIGPPDGTTYDVYAPACLTLNFSITVNGHASYDFVYYEFPNGSGIFLDWAIVEVSDGSNWYTIFNWGDNYPNSNPDTNTNMDFTILLPPLVTPPTIPPEEPDERDIQASDLYTDPISGLSTGIAIDLDSVVPAGTYPYLRFCAPPDGLDGHMEIDAIAIIP
jgi:hypothetical protein